VSLRALQALIFAAAVLVVSLAGLLDALTA
jgi:hypothetical protein